jgi:tRNA threonylcarbamoyladenosine biosynthesis protein TsaE
MEARPSITLVCENEAATIRLGRRLAGLVRDGDVIVLDGDLGSGKTVFARAFILALGGGPEVPSPTFTLVQSYELEPGASTGAQSKPGAVHHFDLFRLGGPGEVAELGLEECLARGVTLIEWPDRLGPLLPVDRLDMRFEFDVAAEARRVHLTGFGDWPDRLERLGD